MFRFIILTRRYYGNVVITIGDEVTEDNVAPLVPNIQVYGFGSIPKVLFVTTLRSVNEIFPGVAAVPRGQIFHELTSNAKSW